MGELHLDVDSLGDRPGKQILDLRDDPIDVEYFGHEHLLTAVGQ